MMLLLLPHRFFSLTGNGEAGGKATATRRLVPATLNQSTRHRAAWGINHQAAG